MSLSTKPFLTGIFLLVVATLSAQHTPPRHAISFAAGIQSFRNTSIYRVDITNRFSTGRDEFKDEVRVTFMHAALGYAYVFRHYPNVSLLGTCYYTGGSAEVFKGQYFRYLKFGRNQLIGIRQTKELKHLWATALLDINLTKPNPKSIGFHFGLGVAYGVYWEEYPSGFLWNSTTSTVTANRFTYEQGNRWGIPLTLTLNQQLTPQVAIALDYYHVFWEGVTSYRGLQGVFRCGLSRH